MKYLSLALHLLREISSFLFVNNFSTENASGLIIHGEWWSEKIGQAYK